MRKKKYATLIELIAAFKRGEVSETGLSCDIKLYPVGELTSFIFARTISDQSLVKSNTALGECLDALTDIFKTSGEVWIAELLKKHGRESDWCKLNGIEEDVSDAPDTGFADIGVGDVVQYSCRYNPDSVKTGVAVIFNKQHQSWVLNIGGQHGTPKILDKKNFVKIVRRAK